MSKVKSTFYNREKLTELLKQPIEVKVAIMRSYDDLCSLLANDILDELTKQYCGERYDGYGQNKYLRYGFNPGSFKIGSEKMPVLVPRIKSKEDGSVVNLPEYEAIRRQPEPDDHLMQAVIKGISNRDYQGVLQVIQEGFGLSRSSISREFIEQSSRKLEEFQSRSLASYQFMALMIDGKYLASDQIVIALGITRQGEKIPLDFIQTVTENHTAIKGLLSNLIARGFDYQDGLLVCIDGAKGLRKAVEEVFSNKALVQRCQWHKRENVVSYLSDQDQEVFKGKIQRAYQEPEYAVAKEKLLMIEQELRKFNQSAANSLLEGLEETLTLHRIEAPVALRKTFSTTNCIENLNSQLTKYIGRVKSWKNSDQKHRWIGAALLEVEKKMRRINSSEKLKEMIRIIRNETLKT